MTLEEAGNCLSHLGRPAEALAMYQHSLQMISRLLVDADHPDLAQHKTEVADCLRTLGRPAEALVYYQQAVGMYRRLFRFGDVAHSLRDEAECLEEMNRSSDAAAAAR